MGKRPTRMALHDAGGKPRIVRFANEDLSLLNGREIKRGECLDPSVELERKIDRAYKKALKKYGVIE